MRKIQQKKDSITGRTIWDIVYDHKLPALLSVIILVLLGYIIFSRGGTVSVAGITVEPNMELPNATVVNTEPANSMDSVPSNPIVSAKVDKHTASPGELPKKTTVKPKAYNSRPESATTTVPAPATIQGKNINTGINSGHIGDVSTERRLIFTEKQDLINLITQLKETKGVTGKCVMMFSTTNSNGGKMSLDIQEFLISQGYTIDGGGQAITTTLEGIEVSQHGNCIRITVGIL